MKKNREWSRRKVWGKNTKRAEEAERKRLEELQDAVAENDEYLEALGNPWDDMDFVTKKRIGIFFYLSAMRENNFSVTESAHHAAEIVNVSSNTILNWVNGFKTSKEIGNRLISVVELCTNTSDVKSNTG